MLLPEINSWKEWGEVFTDINLWTPVVREICRKENLQIDSIRGVYPGTNAVFILDDKYVIKISPRECRESHINEVDIGKTLGGRVPIPVILSTGIFKDRIDWPYFIMEYKKGDAIRDVKNHIVKSNLMDIYARMGKIVKEIHSTDLKNLSSLDTSYNGWVNFINIRKCEIIKELAERDILPDNIIKEIKEFLDGFSIGKADDLVLLNADLTEDHLLLVEEEGKWRISSLIDIADSRIGEKEYEWIALWFGMLDRDIDGFKAFMAAYGEGIRLDEAFVDRVLAYTFLHQFGAGIIKMTLEKLGNPAFGSLKELREVLWFT